MLSSERSISPGSTPHSRWRQHGPEGLWYVEDPRVGARLEVIGVLNWHHQKQDSHCGKEKSQLDFPGGAVVMNPPANAGDTGSSPGPGRSHMPQSNWARAPQLLSLCSRVHKPQLLSLCSRAHMPKLRKPVRLEPQQEKPPQWEACAPQRRVAPARHN